MHSLRSCVYLWWELTAGLFVPGERSKKIINAASPFICHFSPPVIFSPLRFFVPLKIIAISMLPLLKLYYTKHLHEKTLFAHFPTTISFLATPHPQHSHLRFLHIPIHQRVISYHRGDYFSLNVISSYVFVCSVCGTHTLAITLSTQVLWHESYNHKD